MQQAGEHNAAVSENIQDDGFRVQQCPARDKGDGGDGMLNYIVGNLLDRVKLPLGINGERMRFAPENTKKVLFGLQVKSLKETLFHHIMPADGGEQYTQEEVKIGEGQQYP